MNFKHEKDMLLFTSLHPILIMIYADLNWYAKSRHFVDLTITETISTLAEDKKLNRTSSSHRECRAIDIRTKDLDPFLISELVNYINNKTEYKRFHYLSSGGQKRLAYFHIGNAPHIHLSIHSQFGIKSE
jgi:hypothetical protein